MVTSRPPRFATTPSPDLRPAGGPAVFGLSHQLSTVGRGMVIFRDPTGHRMVTTPVRRVLSEFGARISTWRRRILSIACAFGRHRRSRMSRAPR